MTHPENRKKPTFLRELNLLDTTFLVIGAVIGSGIFMTTGFIAEYLPSPGLILLVWLVGGLITLCGALTFAQPGKSMIGLFILALGIPAFLFWKRRARKTASGGID